MKIVKELVTLVIIIAYYMKIFIINKATLNINKILYVLLHGLNDC